MIAAIVNILGNIVWSAIDLSGAQTPQDYLLALVFPGWFIVVGFILLGAAGELLQCKTTSLGNFAVTCSLITPPGLVIAIPAVILYWVRCEDPRVKAAFRTASEDEPLPAPAAAGQRSSLPLPSSTTLALLLCLFGVVIDSVPSLH